MKHRERADEQDQIDDQRQICDKTGNFVVNGHADERDGQSNQAGEDAGPDRIESESRRDAPLFFDAHRRLQRVLKHTRQPARFFLSKSSCDLRVTTINCILNDRRRLDDAIKHNRKAMMNMRSGDVAELLGALGVEPQMNDPAILFVGSARARNTIAG